MGQDGALDPGLVLTGVAPSLHQQEAAGHLENRSVRGQRVQPVPGPRGGIRVSHRLHHVDKLPQDLRAVGLQGRGAFNPRPALGKVLCAPVARHHAVNGWLLRGQYAGLHPPGVAAVANLGPLTVDGHHLHARGDWHGGHRVGRRVRPGAQVDARVLTSRVRTSPARDSRPADATDLKVVGRAVLGLHADDVCGGRTRTKADRPVGTGGSARTHSAWWVSLCSDAVHSTVAAAGSNVDDGSAGAAA